MDQKLLTDFRSELLDSRFGAKAISTIAESKRFPLHEMRDDVAFGNDSNLLIVFYVQIMPDDFVMQLHR
ncbi:hypothetical protein, partial [Escherichia coli]|uniref:hypothetical protein n=1 Tax=Escherichia coli TaxID=562 RepID=UPI0020235F56